MPVNPTVAQGAHSSQDALLKSRRTLTSLNLPLLGAVAALTILGLTIVHSAVEGSTEYSFSRQVAGVVMGIVAMVVLWRFDYRKLSGYIIPLLVTTCVLMLSPHLPVIGVTVSGATSWVRIFGVQMQPGEPAKIVTIILMAAVVARYRGTLATPQEYLKVVGICLIPFFCIMTQPDLGTGLVILIIGFTILFAGGVDRRMILFTIGTAVLGIAGILILDPVLDTWTGHDVFIKDYQMNRLLVFVDADADPTGVGYNLTQAKIAVGSGGFLGKGLGNGTQSTLGFLPEAPTDFIFCVLAEELGFVGCVVLLSLYAALFVAAFRVVRHSSTLFGKLIVSGIIGMWTFQILENIGMTIGLMPITGIPLPFMSYGSSFMLTNFMATGLILSVWRFRKVV